MTAGIANFSVERVAAVGIRLQIRALGVRRHRSPARWAIRPLGLFTALVLLLLGVAGCASRGATASLPDAADREPAQLLAPSVATVRVEVWSCCLCGGPTHGNSYEALESKRATKMLFQGEFAISAADQNSRPSEFLARNLPDDKKYLARRIYKGIAYHLVSEVHTYVKYRSTVLGSFTMGALQPGDLLVCYPEVY